MRSYHLEAHKCPKCTSVIDAATPIDGKDGPSPGDLTVCFYCGSMLVFDEGLAPARLTEEDFNGLSPTIKRTLVKTQSMILRRYRSDGSEKG